MGAPTEPEIDCPIDLFGPTERRIASITEAINRASNAAQKAPLAEDLQREVATLLACTAHDTDNPNCRLCREFSQLRDKTAALILRAARLAR